MPRIAGMSDLFAGDRYIGPGTVCKVCSRVLSNPESIAAGIGPVCRGGKGPGAAKESDMEFRARYTVEVETVAGVAAIVIRDTGHTEARSVTNDAERVIADLKERGFDLTLPVIYQDSTRRWDGLQVQSGYFSGFYALNSAGSTDYRDARAKLTVMMAMRDPRLGDARPAGPVSGEGA